MDYALEGSEEYDEELINCNLLGQPVSSNFSTTLNSIPYKKGFKMAFLNIVTLPDKIDEIRHSVCNKNVELIAFNETRLDTSIPDGLIHIDGYEVVRKDWSSNGGGVCIYLHNSINFKVRSDLISTELEAVCLEISKPHSKPFLVTTIYQPPNATADFFDHLENLIKQNDGKNKEMYILDDLNCNLLEEKTLFNIPKQKLNSFYELYQLSQLIKEPTRITLKSSSLIS